MSNQEWSNAPSTGAPGSQPKPKRGRGLVKWIGILVLACIAVSVVIALLSGGDDSETAGDGEPIAVADVEDVEDATEQDEPAPEPTDEPEPTNTPRPTSTPRPTTPPVGAARENPAPVGRSVRVPNFEFVVSSVTRPATDIVTSGNMFNTEPDEGYEYVMAEVSATCLEEECAFNPYNFGAIGSENVVYDPELFIAGVDGMLESGEMLQGGTRSGKVFFIVKQGETDLVLRWQPLLGDEVFMALPDPAE